MGGSDGRASCEQSPDDAALVAAARLDPDCSDRQSMQPLDQLGPPGGVVIHRKALSVRQHLDVQTLLSYVNSTVAMLCHLRAPSLLMRAGALATVREWKKRLERQAHSRSIGIELTAQYRVPAIYFLRNFATDGGLISYGP